MARWVDVEREVPELAARVHTIYDAHKHKTIGTIRADGAPRVSGIEADFWNDELWLGSMPNSQKSADLKRDPRFALHNAPVDTEMKRGDAKLSGRVEVAGDDVFATYVEHLREQAEPGEPFPEERFDLFRADVTELVVVSLGDPADHLLIEVWREGRGVETFKR